MKDKFSDYVIISDLDGTLLNNNKEISKENLQAINYFTDNGGRFSVATGRVIEATVGYLENIKINLPIIVYNGGVIYDYKNNKIISESFVDEKQKEIVNRLNEDFDNIGIEIYADRKLYVLKDSGHSKRSATEMLDIIYEVKEELSSRQWHKILVVGESDIIDNIENNFYDKYKINGTRSGKTSYELLPIGESKGQALKRIIEMCNLESKKIICVGDNMNDLELLQESTISFCPENSSRELKEYADFIGPSNDNHMIYHIVEWLESKIN
ncbi:Cof-type HAD-IIB family hydrolase [Clostridium chromiireducens]|uniref:Putative phosphatase n=1 Tax=Clostridium chromiireducens TaxID=225345 RepID=A0A1V4IR69_9CLOT|nr:Cof-type HAD-IIB family hydrolase [Clostridium chromiireducens]OPJ62369.1 putative phosphatase [Clostridium chromiireducens]